MIYPCQKKFTLSLPATSTIPKTAYDNPKAAYTLLEAPYPILVPSKNPHPYSSRPHFLLQFITQAQIKGRWP